MQDTLDRQPVAVTTVTPARDSTGPSEPFPPSARQRYAEFQPFANTPMKNQEAVLAEVAREFPQITGVFIPGDGGSPERQYCGFARLVRELYQQGRQAQLQATFNFLETSLEHGDPALRDWVAGCLQALQDCSAWGEGSADVFLSFLGSATRRVWTTLDAIRSDLADCPTLEAEVLMWRVVHHRSSKNVSRA